MTVRMVNLDQANADLEEFERNLHTKASFALEEGDRQMLVLGLAEVVARRPGWEHACTLLARKLAGEEMFREFLKLCRGQPVTQPVLCDYTHAIKDEPRVSYLARYPKAIGVYMHRTMAGQEVRRKFCARCGEQAIQQGWHLEQRITLEPVP